MPDSFWNTEVLRREVFEAERWLDALATPSSEHADALRRGNVNGSNARLMFILDNDFGQLATVMYLILGQAVARRSTLLLPPRLFDTNASTAPCQTQCWTSEEDILAALGAHAPDVVVLCSAFLFPIHHLLSMEALERVVRAMKQRGCRVVNADPYVGVLSVHPPREIVSFPIPDNAPQALRDIKLRADEILHTALTAVEQLLRDDFQLYPSYPAGPEASGPDDPRNVSFYNPQLIIPATVATARADAASDSRRPHWVFIIAGADHDMQSLFGSREGIAGTVATKLREAVAAGRRPIFIGASQLVDDVRALIGDDARIDLLPFCPWRRLIALLLTAEHAFYWNPISHTILVRLFNGLPVVLFDKGHLVRAIPAMYPRVVDWYYQGWSPPLLDHHAPLTLDAVGGVAEDFQKHAASVRRGFERAPTPEEMIDTILAGIPGATQR